MLDRGPRESELLPFHLRRRSPGDHGRRRPIEPEAIPLLDEKASRHRPHIEVVQTGTWRLSHEHDHAFPTRQHVFGLVEDLGRDHHVRDYLHDLFGSRPVEWAVDPDDAPERRDCVALVGKPVCRGKVLRHCQSARVHMLDDRRGRRLVIAHQLKGSRGVLDVVEAKLLALDLHRPAHSARVGPESVESGLLVLVLTVFKRLGEQTGERDLRRETVGLDPAQVGGDPGVVARCVCERLGGEAPPHGRIESLLTQGAQHLRIALRAHDHHHRLVIFGGRANHRRSADVDLLDRLLECHLAARDGLDERVEVAAHQVDLLQAVLPQRVHVLRPVAAREDPCVHARVKRFNPPVHHLGQTRQLGHGTRVDGCVLNSFERAARRIHLVPEAPQAAREAGQTVLVANRQ